jgi:plastocyanin
MKVQRIVLSTGLCASTLLAAACGGENEAADGQPASGAEPAGASAEAFSTSQLTPDAGGKVVTVQMETDAQGNNKYDPATFEVKQGDVIRYTLKTGVHNVHFVADSNANAGSLPTQPSDMLQLPGQTLDVKVSNWTPGSHFYQCDPHAALGMVGRVTVGS